jgi:hypothetical protein
MEAAASFADGLIGRLESPFEEAPGGFQGRRPALLTLSLTPFADSEDPSGLQEADDVLREIYSELRDEGFHDAVSLLADETEAAVEDRFQGEEAANSAERERYARSYLSPVQFEADQYLASLEAGLFETDPALLAPEALEEVLDQFEPQPGDLSPASEQFIGGLVKKAKRVVRKVAGVAKLAGRLASPLLAPMLKKLRGLVRPLLERVLRFAIGKLPAPLQPQARILADRILGKPAAAAPAVVPAAPVPVSAYAVSVPDPALAAVVDPGPAQAPAQATDTEELADSFDLSLAEAVAFPGSMETEPEQFGRESFESVPESEELSALAESRVDLAERIASSESAEELAPHIEQFVPVLLAALRTGIGIVGRPKVISFLSGYLAKMIEQWVSPPASQPLSRAIVDAGLKMMSLEAESGEAPFDEAPSDEAGPLAVASVVEDTIRRLAEADNYLFEDQDLAEVTIADSFGEAAATYLPQETLSEELRLAPSIGGRFVTGRGKNIRGFAKYNRIPEVAISARAADALPAFAGGNLGSAIRVAGGRFPLRARMHIFQARPGSTVGSMLRHGMRGSPRTMGVFPLTPRAAGVLLREPGLGVRSPARFLHSSRRIGAGQRLYVLEPLDQTTATQPGKAAAPGRTWVAISPAKSRITLGFYLSESDAQLLAGALRTGRGHLEVLRKIVGAYQHYEKRDVKGTDGLAHEDGEDLESFAARTGSHLPAGFLPLLRKQIAAWAIPALASWLRSNSETFLRAAAHPDPGVRLRVRLSDVPGLARAVAGGERAALGALQLALKHKPRISIAVSSGTHPR